MFGGGSTSDLKLFKIVNNKVDELRGGSATLEKSLQTRIENHLETFLGIKFFASEYSTGKSHKGRIDTLGIDEDKCPVIIEFKRAVNENVINQGLYYLDWLMDHQAEFELLVLKSIEKKTSESIEWSSPRLLCIAGDFTKFDKHAVQQMDRNIELIRYMRYGNELLLFELVNATTATTPARTSKTGRGKKEESKSRVLELLEKAGKEQKDLYENLRAYLLSLGDDIQEKTLKHYLAFKRIKNLACVEIHPQSRKIKVYVRVNPDTIHSQKGFSKDVRHIGHYGVGDLELTINNLDDFEKAKPLLLQSYENS